MKGVLTMSLKEFDRLQIVNQLEEKRLKVKEASEFLKLSERQLYRLLKRKKEEGTKRIIHKLRGKESNNGYSEAFRKKVLDLYKKEYWDYGPTLFTEVLIKYHNISICKETARKWLRNESITTSIRKKRPPGRREKEGAALENCCSLMVVIMTGLRVVGQNVVY
jgi:hypothetical protein